MPATPSRALPRQANGRLPRGRLLSLRTPAPHELGFHAYLPRTPLVSDRVLVCVHGINRQARDQAIAFQALAERLGVALIAPLFDTVRYPRYQRLAVNGEAPRADVALDAAVTQLTGAAGLDKEPQRLLFGYSGGGQFAHRYAAIHPERVAAVVIGAAGWYTLPDPQRRFPHGLGRRKGFPAIDSHAYLDIPMAVLVGDRDRERGAGFNCTESKDRDPGRPRVDRGRHFVARMRCAARRHGLETDYRFELLPSVGHSFRDAVQVTGLVEKVGTFLVAAGAAEPAVPSVPLSPAAGPGNETGPTPEGGPCVLPLVPAQAFG